MFVYLLNCSFLLSFFTPLLLLDKKSQPHSQLLNSVADSFYSLLFPPVFRQESPSCTEECCSCSENYSQAFTLMNYLCKSFIVLGRFVFVVCFWEPECHLEPGWLCHTPLRAEKGGALKKEMLIRAAVSFCNVFLMLWVLISWQDNMESQGRNASLSPGSKSHL